MANSLRADVIDKLQRRGLKITPQRVQILVTLKMASAPLTARAVWEAVRREQPNVSLDTVYRNLGLLVESGLISQVNLQNRESARFEFQGEGRHHHHFVCLDCGRAFCVDACPVPVVHAAPRDDPGFQVSGHAFEVYGRCTLCQSHEPTPPGSTIFDKNST